MQDYTVLQLQNQLKAAAIPTFGVTVLLVLIISLLLSSNLTRSIRMLSGSVKYISDGKYEQYRTSRPKIGRIQDESARLVVVLDKMVDDVQKREISLKSEIQTLKIEIDQNALKNKVLEVTETEYFQKLQEKAKAMRNSPKKTIEPENVE